MSHLQKAGRRHTRTHAEHARARARARTLRFFRPASPRRALVALRARISAAGPPNNHINSHFNKRRERIYAHTPSTRARVRARARCVSFGPPRPAERSSRSAPAFRQRVPQIITSIRILINGGKEFRTRSARPAPGNNRRPGAWGNRFVARANWCRKRFRAAQQNSAAVTTSGFWFLGKCSLL